MRVRTLVLLGACAVCVGVTALIVQAQNARVDVDRSGVRVGTNSGNTQQEPTILRSRDVLGLRVYNSANESLGKIEDIAIDPNVGKIRYAVLSFGGILGMGDKYFAVPWPKLSFVAKGQTSAGTPKESYVVLDVSKEALKNAPGFDKDKWPNFADAKWNTTVDQFYGGSRQASGQRNRQQ
jgi:sporulation protein YlmC with PRC-barrel domain